MAIIIALAIFSQWRFVHLFIARISLNIYSYIPLMVLLQWQWFGVVLYQSCARGCGDHGDWDESSYQRWPPGTDIVSSCVPEVLIYFEGVESRSRYDGRAPCGQARTKNALHNLKRGDVDWLVNSARA